jgi:arylsulfatase A-like enzyme
LCCPSRASTMTGQYAHNHKVKRNGNPARLALSHTLQRDLKGAGYMTAMIGKFLNGWNPREIPPDFNQTSLLVAPNSAFAPTSTDGYTRTLFSINGRPRIVTRYSTEFLARRARKTLVMFSRRDRRPWLMYVDTYAPHSPFKPAPRHSSATVPGLQRNPAVTERDLRRQGPRS